MQLAGPEMLKNETNLGTVIEQPWIANIVFIVST